MQCWLWQANKCVDLIFCFLPTLFFIKHLSKSFGRRICMLSFLDYCEREQLLDFYFCKLNSHCKISDRIEKSWCWHLLLKSHTGILLNSTANMSFCIEERIWQCYTMCSLGCKTIGTLFKAEHNRVFSQIITWKLRTKIKDISSLDRFKKPDYNSVQKEKLKRIRGRRKEITGQKDGAPFSVWSSQWGQVCVCGWGHTEPGHPSNWATRRGGNQSGRCEDSWDKREGKRRRRRRRGEMRARKK